MKQFKSIIVLTGLSAAIVVFWLAPGINKARSGYVRAFEDTEANPVVAKHLVVELADTAKSQARKPVKKYVSEKISAEATLEDLEPEMFSRAIHFHEEIVLLDSFLVAQEDSIAQVSPLLDIAPVTITEEAAQALTVSQLDSLQLELR